MHVVKQETDASFKICIFGEGGVGKTTLTNRFVSGKFDLDTKMTLGAEIFVKYLNVEDKKVQLQIWDFGGEEMFRFLLPSYSMGSSGALFMFDITRLTTIGNINDWLSIFKQGLDERERNIPIILVGGKLDLEHKRSGKIEDVVDISKEANFFDYIECSSKSGKNVELIFEKLVRVMLENANIITVNG